jgi:hypothetical protein
MCFPGKQFPRTDLVFLSTQCRVTATVLGASGQSCRRPVLVRLHPNPPADSASALCSSSLMLTLLAVLHCPACIPTLLLTQPRLFIHSLSLSLTFFSIFSSFPYFPFPTRRSSDLAMQDSKQSEHERGRTKSRG